jgi:phospholipase C
MLMSNSMGIEFDIPMLKTLVSNRPQAFGTLSWKTMPEALDEAGGPKNPVTGTNGVSWKVYGDPTAQLLFNVLPYFKQYQSDAQLAANAFAWQFPASFAADVAAGTLPQVSWILPPANACEHPAAPPSQGEDLVYQILTTLTANPAVWAHTVVFVIYDENGGWFDHVPPPTPSFSTDIEGNKANAGEWLGKSAAGTTTVPGPSAGMYEVGPVGLGFRTPCLVLSPFTQGGFVCSPYFTPSLGAQVQLDPAGTFDHTSINRFIATVFNAQGYDVQLPNLSPWRAGVTGDFTHALAGAVPGSPPSFTPPVSTTDAEAAAAAVINGLAGTESDAPLPYPSPTNNAPTFPPASDGGALRPTFTPA